MPRRTWRHQTRSFDILQVKFRRRLKIFESRQAWQHELAASGVALRLQAARSGIRTNGLFLLSSRLRQNLRSHSYEGGGGLRFVRGLARDRAESKDAFTMRKAFRRASLRVCFRMRDGIKYLIQSEFLVEPRKKVGNPGLDVLLQYFCRVDDLVPRRRVELSLLELGREITIPIRTETLLSRWRTPGRSLRFESRFPSVY